MRSGKTTRIFSAIVADVKPRDTFVLLLARDFTHLEWEYRRERKQRQRIIELARLEWISKYDSPARPSFLEMAHLPPTTKKLAKLWSADAEARQSLENRLAKQGFDSSFIMTQVMKQIAPEIEEIDRRIGNFETRRMDIMKAIERNCEASARRLAASADVIEGEFTEAAE